MTVDDRVFRRIERRLCRLEAQIQNVEIITTKSDFPTPLSGVITLEAGKTYIITDDVDLTGDRLVTDGIVNLFGLSSETSSLTSTGLLAGVPLVTSEYTTVVESITFKDVDTAISIDGNSNLVALDWVSVNFLNVTNVGVINTCDNFIFTTGAFLNSQGLRFTGTIGTIGINNSLLVGTGSTGNILELDASAIVTRRFRLNYSSIVAPGLSVGVNVNTNAVIPVEAYILDTVNFSGVGVYISGVLTEDNRTLFVNCVGIQNTAVNGQMYMVDNVTATVITNTTDFEKVAGTTIASIDNEKYTHLDNRLTNNAVIERKYLIQATISFTSGNNNVCEFGFYDSELGAIRIPSRTKTTANAAGRAENVHLMCVVNHSVGDYVEVHVRNTSAVANITVTDMNVTITEIK